MTVVAGDKRGGDPLVDTPDVIVDAPFEEALIWVKMGKKIARLGWNGPGQWVVAQRAYPDGIAINENTARATGRPVGTVMIFDPYLMLHNAQGHFVPWTPSQGDLFATDWAVVE